MESKDEDKIRIATLCEFLFSDQFGETATFNRFELCFQPLFNNIVISLDKVFKYICGTKKKYITFKRFAKAYLEFINGKSQSEDAKKFFQILINDILKVDEFIGAIKENKNIDNSENELKDNSNNYYILFSNEKNCQKRDCITKLQITIDNEDNIHGINLQYDENYESQMNPDHKNFMRELKVILEINLKTIDEELMEENIKKFSYIKQGNYRDAITHIFGTIDEEDEELKYITFIGFKCISGKTLFFGNPKGKGFLFGKFGYKFHYLTLQLNNDGINYLKPGFKENIRTNHYLGKIFEKFSEQDLERNEVIKEEDYFINLKDENEIDQLITTQIIPEDKLNENNLKEEYPGNDYKEVVDQSPRKWILNSKKDDKKLNESLTLEGALQMYDSFTKINLEESYSSYNKNYNPMISSISLDSLERIELPFIPNPFAYEEQKVEQVEKVEHSDETIANPVKEEIILPRKAKPFKPEIRETVFANGTKIKIIKEKWDGDINKPINPNIFLDKENYQKLLDKIKENILELSEKNEDKKNIMSQKGKKTVIISKSKNCDLNIQKMQTEIKKKIDKLSPLEKWQFFRKKIEKSSGIFLLQTIGSIIRANLILQNKIKKVSIEERFKLLQKCYENQAIIDFLNYDNCKQKNDLHIIRTTILKPNKQSEKMTSLQVLQKQLDDIRNLLKDKSLEEEKKLKLKKLMDLFKKQKNIFIENESENIKKGGFIKEILENTNKYLEIEKRKILQAKEEEKERIKKITINQRKTELEEMKTKRKNQNEIQPIKAEKVFKKQESFKDGDDLFKAIRKSLCLFDKKGNWIIPKFGSRDLLKGWENFEWSSIRDIKKNDPYDVFYEGATLNDIKQGGIGDCYFLSAIGSLTTIPNFIESHFCLENKKQNIYGILFLINGIWKKVLVDDMFPCTKYKENPFMELSFSSSFQNEIWVSLIEKAWAKVNGSYANIGYGGYSYEVFDFLTEAYSEQIKIEETDKDEVWTILENSVKRKYLMTASSNTFNLYYSYKYSYRLGLEENHAYTIVKTQIIEPNKNEKVKLVKLRNPYGEKEFTGDWGKHSIKWTKDLKKKYKYNEEIEKFNGMFYMSFDDFYKCFKFLDICKIEKDYQTSYCQIKRGQAKKFQILKLEVDKEYKRTYIQLYKKNLRIVRKKNFHHLYNGDNNVMGFIILVKSENNKNRNGTFELKYVNSIAGYETHLAIEADLTEGVYYILCDVNYRYNNQEHGYTITCYHKSSGKKLKLENITENEKDRKHYLELAVSDYCLYAYRNKILVEKNGVQYHPYTIDNKKEKNGYRVFIKDSFDDEIKDKKFPFYILCFKNITKNDIEIKTEIKNIKSAFFYNEENEESTSVINKKIKSYRMKSVLIMRYNSQSKVNFEYKKI